MKTSKYIWYFVLCPFVFFLTSCEPSAPVADDIFVSEAQVAELTADGTIYDLNDFVSTFMTEKGNFWSDTCPYRTRSHNDSYAPEVYLFSIDTLPTTGPGIYIRGRISTDDYAGNFYKSMVIQQIVGGVQQNLRISVDLGSSAGMYQMGQEILIRCNGLAVGKYANQPQLCVPSYNNNIYAKNYDKKIGWAPGRIPSGKFRNATHMIGAPDQSKLQYDVVEIKDLLIDPVCTEAGMKSIRELDGRLVELKNVWFTGQYDSAQYSKDFMPRECNTLHPDSNTNANVFAPTTNNIGFPQSRLIKDAAGNMVNVSSSEYAKYANYYLPGANKNGVSDCKNWIGTIRGVLGFYMDNAEDFQNKDKGFLKYKWAVTPRGIKGIGVEDIRMWKEVQPDEYAEWVPKEYNPNE